MHKEIKTAPLIFPHFNRELSRLVVKQGLLNQAKSLKHQFVHALATSGLPFCEYQEVRQTHILIDPYTLRMTH